MVGQQNTIRSIESALSSCRSELSQSRDMLTRKDQTIALMRHQHALALKLEAPHEESVTEKRQQQEEWEAKYQALTAKMEDIKKRYSNGSCHVVCGSTCHTCVT